jgi:hypothetical protein
MCKDEYVRCGGDDELSVRVKKKVSDGQKIKKGRD